MSQEDENMEKIVSNSKENLLTEITTEESANIEKSQPTNVVIIEAVDVSRKVAAVKNDNSLVEEEISSTSSAVEAILTPTTLPPAVPENENTIVIKPAAKSSSPSPPPPASQPTKQVSITQPMEKEKTTDESSITPQKSSVQEKTIQNIESPSQSSSTKPPIDTSNETRVITLDTIIRKGLVEQMPMTAKDIENIVPNAMQKERERQIAADKLQKAQQQQRALANSIKNASSSVQSDQSSDISTDAEAEDPEKDDTDPKLSKEKLNDEIVPPTLLEQRKSPKLTEKNDNGSNNIIPPTEQRSHTITTLGNSLVSIGNNLPTLTIKPMTEIPEIIMNIDADREFIKDIVASSSETTSSSTVADENTDENVNEKSTDKTESTVSCGETLPVNIVTDVATSSSGIGTSASTRGSTAISNNEAKETTTTEDTNDMLKKRRRTMKKSYEETDLPTDKSRGKRRKIGKITAQQQKQQHQNQQQQHQQRKTFVKTPMDELSAMGHSLFTSDRDPSPDFQSLPQAQQQQHHIPKKHSKSKRDDSTDTDYSIEQLQKPQQQQQQQQQQHSDNSSDTKEQRDDNVIVLESTTSENNNPGVLLFRRKPGRPKIDKESGGHIVFQNSELTVVNKTTKITKLDGTGGGGSNDEHFSITSSTNVMDERDIIDYEESISSNSSAISANSKISGIEILPIINSTKKFVLPRDTTITSSCKNVTTTTTTTMNQHHQLHHHHQQNQQPTRSGRLVGHHNLMAKQTQQQHQQQHQQKRIQTMVPTPIDDMLEVHHVEEYHGNDLLNPKKCGRNQEPIYSSSYSQYSNVPLFPSQFKQRGRKPKTVFRSTINQHQQILDQNDIYNQSYESPQQQQQQQHQHQHPLPSSRKTNLPQPQPRLISVKNIKDLLPVGSSGPSQSTLPPQSQSPQQPPSIRIKSTESLANSNIMTATTSSTHHLQLHKTATNIDSNFGGNDNAISMNNEKLRKKRVSSVKPPTYAEWSEGSNDHHDAIEKQQQTQQMNPMNPTQKTIDQSPPAPAHVKPKKLHWKTKQKMRKMLLKSKQNTESALSVEKYDCGVGSESPSEIESNQNNNATSNGRNFAKNPTNNIAPATVVVTNTKSIINPTNTTITTTADTGNSTAVVSAITTSTTTTTAAAVSSAADNIAHDQNTIISEETPGRIKRIPKLKFGSLNFSARRDKFSNKPKMVLKYKKKYRKKKRGNSVSTPTTSSANREFNITADNFNENVGSTNVDLDPAQLSMEDNDPYMCPGDFVTAEYGQPPLAKPQIKKTGISSAPSSSSSSSLAAAAPSHQTQSSQHQQSSNGEKYIILKRKWVRRQNINTIASGQQNTKGDKKRKICNTEVYATVVDDQPPKVVGVRSASGAIPFTTNNTNNNQQELTNTINKYLEKYNIILEEKNNLLSEKLSQNKIEIDSLKAKIASMALSVYDAESPNDRTTKSSRKMNMQSQHKIFNNNDELPSASQSNTSSNKLNNHKEDDHNANTSSTITTSSSPIVEEPMNWSPMILAQAYSLQKLSKSVYQHFQLKNNLSHQDDDQSHQPSPSPPMPSIQDIDTYLREIKLTRGLLTQTVQILECDSEHMSDLDRVTILQISEIPLRSVYEYDIDMDEIVGPHTMLTAIIARGLYANWTQILFIDLDSKSIKMGVNQVIETLHKLKFPVVACAAKYRDGESTKIWSDLDVVFGCNYFPHPITEEFIYVFYYMSDLLLTIQKQFLTHGFSTDMGLAITKQPIEELITKITTSTKSKPRTNLHAEQIIRLSIDANNNCLNNAIELFSNETANLLRIFSVLSSINNSLDDVPTIKTMTTKCVIDFLTVINSFYQIMMSKETYNSSTTVLNQLPYGKNLQHQNNILNKIQLNCYKIRCPDQTDMADFQRATLLSIESLKMLQHSIKQKYKIDSFSTEKITNEYLNSRIKQHNTNQQQQNQTNHHLLNTAFLDKTIKLENKEITEQERDNTTTINVATVISDQKPKLTVLQAFNRIKEIFLMPSTNLNFEDHHMAMPNETCFFDGEIDTNKLESFYVELLFEWLVNNYKEKHRITVGQSTEEFVHKMHRFEELFQSIQNPKFNIAEGAVTKVFNRLKSHKIGGYQDIIHTFVVQRHLLRIKYFNATISVAAATASATTKTTTTATPTAGTSNAGGVLVVEK